MRHAHHQDNFDKYVEDYDNNLAQGLSLTGEDKSYFATGRVRWLARKLKDTDFTAHTIMDYGCGDGSTVPILSNTFHPDKIIGVDPSSRSIDLARQNYNEVNMTFTAPHTPPHERFDLIYTNGVLHHIAPNNRLSTVIHIYHSLHPGGMFALWENNPYNPATRIIMNRVNFDQGCIMLQPHSAKKILLDAGFSIVSTSYIFIFPRFLNALRFCEPFFSAIPLGGQYLILAKKHG